MCEKIETKIKKNNSYIPAEFILYEDSESYEFIKLELNYENTTLTARAHTYFEALIQIRKILESEGGQIICKGSSKSVYPSAMILSMGDGRLAYELELGKPSSITNLVDIFDECRLEECTTVEQQEKFYYNWIKTPKEIK